MICPATTTIYSNMDATGGSVLSISFFGSSLIISDSLQATWIRNSVLYALRDRRGVDVDAIPTNFVYAHPTVRLLAELLTMLAAGEEISPSLEAEALAMA